MTGHLADMILLSIQETQAMMVKMGHPGAVGAMGGGGGGGAGGGGRGGFHSGGGGGASVSGGGMSVASLQNGGGGSGPGGAQQGMLTAGGQVMRGMETRLDAEIAVKELRQQLQYQPMFRDAPGDFLDKLVSMMNVEYVGARQTLLQEGDRGTKMCYFVQGTAEIISEIDGRRKVSLCGIHI